MVCCHSNKGSPGLFHDAYWRVFFCRLTVRYARRKTMSELDDLRRYLNDGFQPMMILRDVDKEELRRQGIPEASEPLKALPLKHPDGRGIMLYLREQDAIAFARELVRDLRTISGYTLYVQCTATGPHLLDTGEVDLGQVIERLREILGWEVRLSPSP